MQRRVSGGRRSRSASSCGRHLAVKISLSVSSDRQYLARVACMRFLSWVRIFEKAILVRGSSRSSRSSPGGIHTEGSVPLCSKRPSPSASSLSVLPKVPGTGVDVAHHELRLGGVGQVRHTTSALDFVDDPVPVPHRFHGDRGSGGELGEGGTDRTWAVGDPPPGLSLAVPVEDSKQ